ncbi:hypothetical protein SLA2020_486870 [Shorea laevis]
MFFFQGCRARSFHLKSPTSLMAAETVSSPLTPGVSPSDGGNARRKSVGSAVSSDSGKKILPHYLRASTGSCHDFCKYGKKHAFEEKARLPISKRIPKKPSGERSSVESLDLPQVKRTLAVKLKPSPDSRSHTPDSSEIIKREVSLKYPGSKIPRKHEVLSDKKTSLVNLRPSSNSKSRLSEPPRFKKQEESSSSEKVRVSSKEASSGNKGTSVPLKHTTSLKLKSWTEKVPSSPAQSGVSYVRRLSGINDVKTRKKTGTSKVAVKNTVAMPRASFSPRSINGNARLITKQNNSLKDVSSLKKQNKVKKAGPERPCNELTESNNDALQEKTLYVIKMETENEVFESDKNESCVVESSPLPPFPRLSSLPNSPSSSSDREGDQEESEWTVTEAENDSSSDYNETGNLDGKEYLEGENRSRPVMDGMVCSDVKNSKSVKLHFRRGKVVDIQTGHNGPRRLKFRQGKVLGENPNSKAVGRRSLRMRGADEEANDNKPSEQKVVLRHQDAEGKKDSQGLFNVVIEETASKLAETRKSKVKALVGAFETVISLQEKKPAA